MTGPEHYQEAERLTAMCVTSDGNPPVGPAPELDNYLKLAMVHATLALAAATALNDGEAGMDVLDMNNWTFVAGLSTSGSDGA